MGFSLRKRSIQWFIHVESRTRNVGSKRLGRSGRGAGGIVLNPLSRHDLFWSHGRLGSNFPGCSHGGRLYRYVGVRRNEETTGVGDSSLEEALSRFRGTTQGHV